MLQIYCNLTNLLYSASPDRGNKSSIADRWPWYSSESWRQVGQLQPVYRLK